jgi:hypothetical protein
VQHATGTILLQVPGEFVLGVIELFRLFFGVEVIQVAEPFVEPVTGRQELVAVPEMVLSKLRRSISLRLEHFGQCRVTLLNASGRPGNADRSHARTERELAHDERRAPSGTTGLSIVIGKEHPFLRDPIDVGCVAHHAVGIGADIPHADIISKDDENVWFFVCHSFLLYTTLDCAGDEIALMKIRTAEATRGKNSLMNAC